MPVSGLSVPGFSQAYPGAVSPRSYRTLPAATRPRGILLLQKFGNVGCFGLCRLAISGVFRDEAFELVGRALSLVSLSLSIYLSLPVCVRASVPLILALARFRSLLVSLACSRTSLSLSLSLSHQSSPSPPLGPHSVKRTHRVT